VSQTDPNDPCARRDRLLKQLIDQYDQLTGAAKDGNHELIEELLDKRQGTIDALITLADQAPIPPEVGTSLTEREAALQTLMNHELNRSRGSMGRAARHGQAALRYKKQR
jgi:hypothetical protein